MKVIFYNIALAAVGNGHTRTLTGMLHGYIWTIVQ